MKLQRWCLAVLLGLPCFAAAESLKCEGGMVSEGDSRLSVIYKCGQPTLADSYCSPVYIPGTLDVLPTPYALRFVPCNEVEAWLYERGPGRLLVVLYMRAGVVRTISYGRDVR
jgi:hypothetical protein